MFTDTQLKDVLHGINYGISESYFRHAAKGSVPRKEILAEAKLDLETVLRAFDINDSNNVLLKLRKYKEIIDVIEQIPDEVFIKRQELSDVLEKLTYSYTYYHRNTPPGEFIGRMLPHKYKLIEEKGKIQTEIDLQGDGSLRILVELANKYIELLRLDYPKTSTADTN